MSEFKQVFNRSASKAKEALSYAFASAALSKPGQMFIRNAGRISGFSFLGGDLLLGIQYALPAAGFITSDAFLASSDFQNRPYREILPKLPVGNLTRRTIAAIAPQGLRAAGFASLTSTGILAYLVRNEPGHAALWTSCSFIALQAGSWIFEKQFHHLAEKAAQAKSKILSQVFAPVAKYPVLSMTALDNVGKIIMAYGAVKGGDYKLLAATAIWGVGGNGGVVCKDENVARWIDKKKIAREQSNFPPAPMVA